MILVKLKWKTLRELARMSIIKQVLQGKGFTKQMTTKIEKDKQNKHISMLIFKMYAKQQPIIIIITDNGNNHNNQRHEQYSLQ